VQQAYEVLSDDNKRREYDRTLRTCSREDSGRPRAEEAGAETGGGAAHGATERVHRARRPMFRLGYLLGIVLVAVVVALLILLILGLE
jgi:curved DNA-binding protein CbpA